MATEPRKIKVTPGSELDKLLAEAGDTPLLLEKDGEFYRLRRTGKEKESVWEGYDPQKVRVAIRECAGALAGVDAEKLIRDIYKARKQGSRGRPTE